MRLELAGELGSASRSPMTETVALCGKGTGSRKLMHVVRNKAKKNSKHANCRKMYRKSPNIMAPLCSPEVHIMPLARDLPD